MQALGRLGATLRGSRRAAIGMAALAAISALAGGIELIVFRHGSNAVMPPVSLLEHTPFADFLVPGLILACAIGGTSAVAALAMWRKWRWAVDATILAGGALSVWILAEASMLRTVHWLHFVYGVLGAALLALGAIAAWRSELARQRWIVRVALAEALGFLAPASAGVLSSRFGLNPAWEFSLLVAAGCVEGAALGAGQAFAFPFEVRRARYALWTALAAGAVWWCALSLGEILGRDDLPAALRVAAGVGAAAFGLLAIGSAQWIELRRHVPHAARWIGWTALAWLVALPLSFTPSPFVDEATPLAPQLTLWGCAGALMAYVMAQVTWLGVKRLGHADPPRSHAGS